MKNHNQPNQPLTPSQWKLYRYLRDRSLFNLDTCVAEICEFMPDVYTLNGKESNFSNCPTLYKDIDIINASTEVEKIIIKDNNNFKLATKEEARRYADKMKERAIKVFKKYWDVERKIANDGQGKLVSCQNEAIDETSQARHFVETFIKEVEDGVPR